MNVFETENIASYKFFILGPVFAIIITVVYLFFHLTGY